MNQLEAVDVIKTTCLLYLLDRPDILDGLNGLVRMGGLEGPYISQNPIWVRSRVLLHSPVKNQVKLFTYEDNHAIPDISPTTPIFHA